MKKSQVTILALTLLVGVASGLALSASARLNVAAQKSVATTGDDRWDYCMISDMGVHGQDDKAFGTATICYLQASGCRKVVVEGGDEKGSFEVARANTLAKAVAKLGAEGWELVGEGTQFGLRGDTGDPKAIYFRRRQK
jgi:hypothetical protein